jgi:hypothetical protein
MDRRLSALTVFVVLVGLLLAGCSTTSTVVMVDRIREDHGYALVVVHTNWEPYEIGFDRLQLHYVALADGHSGKVRTRRSGELELVELPAGEYRWRELQLGSDTVPLSPDSGFRVTEGAITYIGNLACDYDPATRKIIRAEVLDAADDVRVRVEQANAPLLERYRFVDAIMTLKPDPPLPGAPD